MSIKKAIKEAVIWRILAVFLSSIVLLVNDLPLLQTGIIAIETHIVLLVGQVLFYYLRKTGK